MQCFKIACSGTILCGCLLITNCTKGYLVTSTRTYKLIITYITRLVCALRFGGFGVIGANAAGTGKMKSM